MKVLKVMLSILTVACVCCFFIACKGESDKKSSGGVKQSFEGIWLDQSGKAGMFFTDDGTMYGVAWDNAKKDWEMDEDPYTWKINNGVISIYNDDGDEFSSFKYSGGNTVNIEGEKYTKFK